MSQIQISYFSRHFYVVNVILLSVLHFWTNFDTKKILFIFYDSFFRAMAFSECPEAVQEISDRLLYTLAINIVFLNKHHIQYIGLIDKTVIYAIGRSSIL